MMVRKGFTREQRNEYRRLKATGLSDGAVGRIWGVNPSTVSRTKRGLTRMRSRTWERVQAGEVGVGFRGEQIGKYSTITFGELSRMAESPNIKTQRAAVRELNRLEREGYSVADLTRLGLEGKLKRPLVSRTVKGKRVTVLLGRGKDADQRRAVEEQLRAQGVDPANYQGFYDEATGYTTI